MKLGDLNKINAALFAKARNAQFEFSRVRCEAISAQNRVQEIKTLDSQAKAQAAGVENIADIKNAQRYKAELAERLKSAQMSASAVDNKLSEKKQALSQSKLQELVADRLSTEAWRKIQKKNEDLAERRRESLSIMRLNRDKKPGSL